MSEIKKNENICEENNSKLSKFIFSTKKDINLFIDFEYDDSFNEIFDNAPNYRDEVIALLDCSNLTEFQKRYLIHTMNGLNFDQYIDFIQINFDMYKSGHISNEIFESTILFNNISHKYYISKYYQNIKVIKLLNQIKANKKVKGTELEKRINNVLSGKHWKETLKFYSGAGMSGHTELLEGW